MNIAILGLSVTSSWGNGHATTYRSLIKGLKRRGHKVVFLERDMPWYSSNCDMPNPDFCKLILYSSVDQLREEYARYVEEADAVIVGSYVPDGIAVSEWVLAAAPGIKAFYDIDTPVTLSKLRNKCCQYLAPGLIPRFNLYLSFSAGPCLDIFECEFGSPAARQLYCSVDPELYYPSRCRKQWDLGYIGTYSDDRQPSLNEFFVKAAKNWEKGRFVVAGSQYPVTLSWPDNVERIEHLPPAEHNDFYNSMRYTMNITRQDMIRMGYSPSVRLFEAAACGIPVISDYWTGIYTIFNPGSEILITCSPDETLKYLRVITETQRKEIGMNARNKVLEKHTGEHRAIELERYFSDVHIRSISGKTASRI